MCMGAEAIWVPLLMSAASAGVSAYGANKTAKRQDAALADSIRNQSRIQKQADARVNEEVANLKESRSSTDEAQRMNDYVKQLQRGRQNMVSGLTNVTGGEAAQTDSAQAAQAAGALANQTAGFMAQQDAAGMQRQREGFDFGRLATDIGLIGRESSGQRYLDELRLRAIREDPKYGIMAGLIGGLGGAIGGGGVANTMTKDTAGKIGLAASKTNLKPPVFYGG